MNYLNKFSQMREFPSYQINRRGVIIGHHGTPIKAFENEKGYMTVTLNEDGNIYRRKVHRLVADQFIRNRSYKKTHVHHVDGDKGNNCSENLRWETPSDHRKHNASPNHLTDSQRRQIMTRIQNRPKSKTVAVLFKELSEKYNISRDYISNMWYLRREKKIRS